MAPESLQKQLREGAKKWGEGLQGTFTQRFLQLQNHELFLPKIRGRNDGKYRETNPCIQATPWCQYLLGKITRLQRKEVKKLEGNCRVGSKGRKPESEQLKSCSPSLMGFLLWEGMVQTVGKRLKETLGISLENGHLFQGKGSRGLRENAWEKKEEEREKREKR